MAVGRDRKRPSLGLSERHHRPAGIQAFRDGKGPSTMMRIVFYWYDHHTDKLIADALAQSIRSHGDTVTVLPRSDFEPDRLGDFDVVFTRGISESRPIMHECLAKGVHVVYCDKGYFSRGWNDEQASYRLSVNSFHPLRYFQMRPRPADRWEALGVSLRPREQNGQNIVFASIPPK